MIVDVIGLPGSGKSTLARALVEELRGRSLDAACPDDATQLVSSCRRARTPWPARWLSLASLRAASPASVPRGAVVQLWRLDDALRRAHTTGVAITHEGAFHRLCIALAVAGRTDARTVDRIASRMALPDVLVDLRVPTSVAHARVRAREGALGHPSRLEALESDAWSAWRRGYRAAADRLVSLVERSRPVLVVDGTSTDVRERALALAEWIVAFERDRESHAERGGARAPVPHGHGRARARTRP